MITFDQTLDKIQVLFQQEPLLSINSKFEEATIIRDIQGKIHLYFHSLRNSLSAQDKQILHQEMTRHLGPYYTKDIWESTDHKIIDIGLVDLIKEERVHLPDFSTSNNWYLVERHSAKHMWTMQSTGEPPWDIAKVDEGSKPAIVSFFSFKGGTGRTTSLIGTALTLARHGKRVVLVDLDLEAPGLASIFFEENEMKDGVVDYLIEKGVQDHWSIRSYMLPISDEDLISKEGEVLRVIPAGTVNTDFIQKLARLDFQNLTTNTVGERL